MRKIMTLVALCMFLTTQATPPDTTINLRVVHTEMYTIKQPLIDVHTESFNSGMASIVAGTLLTAVGVVREVTREPYPTHHSVIDNRPNSPAVLNYLLIGSGVAFTAYGFKLVFSF
jgi:hypothetical protein